MRDNMSARSCLIVLCLWMLVVKESLAQLNATNLLEKVKQCSSEGAPVCASNGSDLLLFPNECILQETNNETYLGKPRFQEVASGFCLKHCILLCSTVYEPVCALDVMKMIKRTFNNRCEMSRDACLTSTAWMHFEHGECASLKIANLVPDLPKKEVKKNNKTITCSEVFNPVCAILSGVKSTFDNECLVKAENEKTATNWQIFAQGVCAEDYGIRYGDSLKNKSFVRARSSNNSHDYDFNFPEEEFGPDVTYIYTPPVFQTQFIESDTAAYSVQNYGKEMPIPESASVNHNFYKEYRMGPMENSRVLEPLYITDPEIRNDFSRAPMVDPFPYQPYMQSSNQPEMPLVEEKANPVSESFPNQPYEQHLNKPEKPPVEGNTKPVVKHFPNQPNMQQLDKPETPPVEGNRPQTRNDFHKSPGEDSFSNHAHMQREGKLEKPATEGKINPEAEAFPHRPYMQPLNKPANPIVEHRPKSVAATFPNQPHMQRLDKPEKPPVQERDPHSRNKLYMVPVEDSFAYQPHMQRIGNTANPTVESRIKPAAEYFSNQPNVQRSNKSENPTVEGKTKPLSGPFPHQPYMQRFNKPEKPIVEGKNPPAIKEFYIAPVDYPSPNQPQMQRFNKPANPTVESRIMPLVEHFPNQPFVQRSEKLEKPPVKGRIKSIANQPYIHRSDKPENLPVEEKAKLCKYGQMPVCASFKEKTQTFNNYCDLLTRNELMNQAWTVVHDGRCDNCANLKACTNEYKPICASRNGINYTLSNECYLNNEICRDRGKSWRILHLGECKSLKKSQIVDKYESSTLGYRFTSSYNGVTPTRLLLVTEGISTTAKPSTYTSHISTSRPIFFPRPAYAQTTIDRRPAPAMAMIDATSVSAAIPPSVRQSINTRSNAAGPIVDAATNYIRNMFGLKPTTASPIIDTKIDAARNIIEAIPTHAKPTIVTRTNATRPTVDERPTYQRSIVDAKSNITGPSTTPIPTTSKPTVTPKITTKNKENIHHKTYIAKTYQPFKITTTAPKISPIKSLYHTPSISATTTTSTTTATPTTTTSTSTSTTTTERPSLWGSSINSFIMRLVRSKGVKVPDKK